MGLRIFHEYGDGSAIVGVVYFLGGGFLELSTPARANGFSTLWLQVPDVSREETRLRDLGVPLEAPASRKPWGGGWSNCFWPIPVAMR